MNILHLQNELNYTSGAAKYIYILCKNFPAEYQSHLIVFDGYDTKRFEEINVKLKEIKKANIYSDFLRSFFIILNYCIKNKIDVIHSHHRFFDLAAYFISFFIKVKTVMSVHSIIYDSRLFSYKAEKIIAVSNAVKNHLVKNFGIKKEKIFVRYNPVEDPEYYYDNSLTKRELEIPENHKVVSFFGRFDYEKGFDIYISAVKELIAENLNISFLFAGSGRYEKLLEAIKNKGNVKIILPQKNIYSYLAITDLVVLPSRRDPFPYIMLEAGILKKPFLGSSVDGIAEFISDRENGILFNAEDKDDLKDKIIYTLQNQDELKILADNLYKKVTEACNKKKYIHFIINLYSAAGNDENIRQHNLQGGKN